MSSARQMSLVSSQKTPGNKIAIYIAYENVRARNLGPPRPWRRLLCEWRKTVSGNQEKTVSSTDGRSGIGQVGLSSLTYGNRVPTRCDENPSGAPGRGQKLVRRANGAAAAVNQSTKYMQQCRRNSALQPRQGKHRTKCGGLRADDVPQSLLFIEARASIYIFTEMSQSVPRTDEFFSSFRHRGLSLISSRADRICLMARSTADRDMPNFAAISRTE